jgi:hypothetical protein
MARLSRKVWIGIGTFSLLGASSLEPAVAQHKGHAAPASPTAGTSAAVGAPQAGEAYLTDGGPKDTRIRIYRDILLMRGHLLIGAELIELGQWDEALPHFLHPTEELYGLMERYITLHKVPPFKRQLQIQAQAVKARNTGAYRQAATVVEARISKALQVFRGFMTPQPFTSYTVRSVLELMRVAAIEYEASLDGEVFRQTVEYQDGRGFVAAGKAALRTHEGALRRIDAARFEAMMAVVADIEKAWPTPQPPPTPVLSVAALGRLVTAFEAASARFH